MKFDRHVEHPPNATRVKGRHFDNLYVGAQLLQARDTSGLKWTRFGHAESEDAVTWNVLVGLVRECDITVPGAIAGVPGGDLLMRDAALLLWNAPVEDSPVHAQLGAVLQSIQRRIEANPRRPSEIEAVLWNDRLRRLTFIEAKLTSGPGACSAVSDSPRIRKPAASCRMFRTDKLPRDNGCSYWGIGTGGAEFSRSFPSDYVRKHLNFEPPIEAQEERSHCARLYQLMRNALIGREMADALSLQGGGSVEFHLIAIVAAGHFGPRYYCEFAESVKDPEAIRFGLITWQDIGKAVQQSGCQPDVVRYIAGHTCL